MVDEFNFEQVPGADKVAGYADVGFGRFAKTGWALWRPNGIDGGQNRQKKNLTRMNEQVVLRADGNDVMALDPSAGIEK